MAMKKIPYVEPILFGYMFCLYLTMPVEQQLIYHKVCQQYFNKTYCTNLYNSNNHTVYEHNENIIQAKTAQWSIYLSIVRTFPAVISTILYGAWSDKVGRKTYIILPIIGDTILAVSYILNAYFFDAAVPYMFIGGAISAMFGNFAAAISSTYSYVADITDHSTRTKRIIILESMIFLGAVVGNISGGWLLQKSGFMAVFGLITSFYVLQFIYWLFLKESYNPSVDQKKNMDLKTLFSKNAVKETLQVLYKRRVEKYRMTIWLLLGCLFFFLFFFVALNSVSILYILHQPLNFPPSHIGYFLAEMNALKFIGASFINYVLVHQFHFSDYSVMTIAAIAFCGFVLSMANSVKDWQVYVSVIWCLGMGTGESTARAALSKMVAPDEQGKLFSVAACLASLVALISSTSFSAVYKSTVDFFPSFSFYLLAGLTAIPMTLAIILLLKGQRITYTSLGKDYEDISTTDNVVHIQHDEP